MAAIRILGELVNGKRCDLGLSYIAPLGGDGYRKRYYKVGEVISDPTPLEYALVAEGYAELLSIAPIPETSPAPPPEDWVIAEAETLPQEPPENAPGSPGESEEGNALGKVSKPPTRSHTRVDAKRASTRRKGK